MCESDVYVVVGDDETLLMKQTGWIEFDGDNVLLKDVEGREQVLSARLKYADLVGHHIVLERIAGS